ncbi:hypothetical protein CEH05_06985 [Halobacillus halophilus]|uniref:Uncharacterized protein n=1 Tax=Halobacillus halophilus (strain ATCC 35676 / DSM 2266 / JCM 20832 / KCTC 3685 / LMG 17431 / NBRC 102448 / NCIMB 2269) TaxID=866895 RepID=I0JKS0_HALH3|nr:hypothetical protein [Halobacillus halophilus]ASF38871.1 hypothetical protein CEH05_06985 [Halobacillus halophilus]CCG44740.1 hypothetical protein HBHAL_2395 [Halobacillus halophilus DSM 2266]
MNVEILILFINATLVTVVSSIVVIAILRKQYLPVIKEMEKKENQEESTESEEKRINSNI